MITLKDYQSRGVARRHDAVLGREVWAGSTGRLESRPNPRTGMSALRGAGFPACGFGGLSSPQLKTVSRYARSIIARACGGLPDGTAASANGFQFSQSKSGGHAYAAAAGERASICRTRQRHDRSGVRLSGRRLESRAEEGTLPAPVHAVDRHRRVAGVDGQHHRRLRGQSVSVPRGSAGAVGANYRQSFARPAGPAPQCPRVAGEFHRF